MNARIKLVDSHCHLQSIDLTEFSQGMDEVISSAQTVGVTHMLCVCVDLADLPALHKLADDYAMISTSVGIHPNIVMQKELSAAEIAAKSAHPSCIAIGETGLDYYRTEKDGIQVQQERFREHIRASNLTAKPLIIHTRQAVDDTFSILTEEGATVAGVMHCFSENWEAASRALDLDFYISFSGIVTFKNAVALQDVVKKVPLERILIETDSPYLAPVPFRGKQNRPTWVREVAAAISQLRNIDFATVALQTTENFYNCFKLRQP